MLGMILAAGLGMRMRPLSEQLPKPCMPVCGRPLIHHAADLLKSAGVREAAVNLHHLGDLIETLLREGPRLGLRFRFSREPQILGTGGGVRQAWELLLGGDLPDEPLAVANADTVLIADLAPAVEDHRKSGALATLVLTGEAPVQRYGAVCTDGTGRVLDIAGLVGDPEAAGAHAAVFAGAYVLDPAIYSEMPARGSYCIVRDVFVPLLKRGARIRAVTVDGPWMDAGEPADYLAANRRVLELAARAFGQTSGAGRLLAMHFPIGEGVFAAPMARIDIGVVFRGPVLVESGAHIESEAVVGPNAIVGGRARIGAKARIADCVVWDGAVVEAEAELSNCVVTREGVFPVGPTG